MCLKTVSELIDVLALFLCTHFSSPLTHLVFAGTLASGDGAVAAAAAGGGEGAGSVVGMAEGASEFRGRVVVRLVY